MSRIARPLLFLLAGLPLGATFAARAETSPPKSTVAPSPDSELPATTGNATFPGYANPGLQKVDPNFGFQPPNP